MGTTVPSNSDPEKEGTEERGEDVEVLPPQEILTSFEGINIAAPMVRYSKLPFRHLVSLYDVHITHTPMILAQEFSRSAVGRRSDFSTSPTERGVFLLRESGSHTSKRQRRVRGALVAQFAANEAKMFADACELIAPHVDGVDLNCGCPQKWAYHEKIGSYLLRQPDMVRDIVRAAKDRIGWNFPVSVKIRLDPDLKRTNQLIETAIHAGASHITVHGRTRHQVSTHPVDLEGIAFAVSCAKGQVPVVANGDVWTYGDVERIRTRTGVQGIMAARGLLANPALFAGYNEAPVHTLSNFVRLSTAYTLPFALTQKHIAFILESAPVLGPPLDVHSSSSNPPSSTPSSVPSPSPASTPPKGVPITRAARAHYHSLTSIAGVFDFLEEECGVSCGRADGGERVVDPWAERRVGDGYSAAGSQS